MSASVTGKKQCITCSKSGGIMICDGCQQSFCGKHSIEHRQELTNQLDGIMQEHDLLQQELGQPSIDNSLLKKINKWEKESIAKIQVAAEAARADLQQILDTSKERISKTCRDIAVNLRSSREADDFSENDLNRWMEQLKELKLEFDSPSSIKLVEDEYSSISLIRIKHSNFTSKKPTIGKQTFVAKTPALSVVHERFSQVFGGVKVLEEGTAIRHMGISGDYVHVLGERLYSQGREVVRFRIRYEKTTYNSFFGCISSRVINDKASFCSSISAGWFGHNQIYHQGDIIDNGYDSTEIRTNDVLSVTFDCENRKIELHHERTNKTNKLQIDVVKAPFPWRLLVVLCHSDDWVKIIAND
jgi:hypothetical protein